MTGLYWHSMKLRTLCFQPGVGFFSSKDKAQNDLRRNLENNTVSLLSLAHFTFLLSHSDSSVLHVLSCAPRQRINLRSCREGNCAAHFSVSSVSWASLSKGILFPADNVISFFSVAGSHLIMSTLTGSEARFFDLSPNRCWR